MPTQLFRSMLLSPDAGDSSGGGGGEAGGSVNASSGTDNAGSGSDAQGVGAPAGGEATPAPENDSSAPDNGAAGQDGDESDSVMEAMAGAVEGQEPEASNTESGPLVSDADLVAILAAIRGDQPKSDAGQQAQGKDAAKPETKAEAKAAETKPGSDTQDAGIVDDASIQAMVDEFPEVEPLAKTAKALAKESAVLKQKNAELEARLQKLEQGVTQTQQQSQERAHFDQVVKPVMTAIDSIPGLDEARFGRFDGQNMTAAQTEQRDAMVRLAQRLSQERLRTHPIDHTLRGAEQAKAWQAHDAAMLEAAHRTLTNKSGVRKEAPTTRSAVIQHARAQASSRSPIGVAASPGKPKSPSTPYTDSDDPVTALDKVFAAHQ